MKIGIDVNRRIIVGEKRDAGRNGIGIRITRTTCSLSIAGSKTSNCPLLETALSAMVMISMIDLIGSIKTLINDLMSRLGGELRFMIGKGADSVCTTDLVTILDTLPGTKRNLRSGKGAYNLILGRDSIHDNCCIPSTIHQCLVQWVGDKIEIVPGDSSYVSHRQMQILMKGPGASQERFGRRISLKLPIMKFHRSKQSF